MGAYSKPVQLFYPCLINHILLKDLGSRTFKFEIVMKMHRNQTTGSTFKNNAFSKGSRGVIIVIEKSVQNYGMAFSKHKRGVSRFALQRSHVGPIFLYIYIRRMMNTRSHGRGQGAQPPRRRGLGASPSWDARGVRGAALQFAARLWGATPLAALCSLYLGALMGNRINEALP